MTGADHSRGVREMLKPVYVKCCSIVLSGHVALSLIGDPNFISCAVGGGGPDSEM